jgi:Zn-finger nucleic acid-binding protein
MFAGMDYCPNCGTNFTRETIGEAGLKCPACKVPMTAMRVGTTALLECGSCYGTWLDTATFIGLCSSKEDRGSFAKDFGKNERTAVAQSRVVYFPCPVCGKIMNRQNFGRASGVVIDVCKGDGTWLQQGELHAVLTFIDTGGLERARDMERIREKEEAKLRQLEQQEPPRASSHSSFSISGFRVEDPDAGDNASLLTKALRGLFS